MSILLFVAAGQVPAGSERGGGGAVHAESDRRVRHRHHGRHGRAAPQPRPVLAQIALLLPPELSMLVVRAEEPLTRFYGHFRVIIVSPLHLFGFWVKRSGLGVGQFLQQYRTLLRSQTLYKIVQGPLVYQMIFIGA